MELGTGTPRSTAAMRSGMSENTARRYRTGPLPSQRKQPRQYRTRPDPFAAIWSEIEALLVHAPGLEATTIFETLRDGPRSDWRTANCAPCSVGSGAGAPPTGLTGR